MSAKFCTNCGSQLAEGAAFCTSCGAPVAAASGPAQPTAPQAPAPVPQRPQPYAAPIMPPQPPAYGAPPAYPGAPGPVGPGGMSRNTMIGIAATVVVAIIIGVFVWRNERDFQRNRRSGSTPVTTSSPSTPAAPYGGYGSDGAPGSDGWNRSQLIGRWTTTNCARATTEFRTDGTTFSTNGNVPGSWTYQNRRVTVVEPSATTTFDIVRIDSREMVTQFPRYQITWRRC